MTDKKKIVVLTIILSTLMLGLVNAAEPELPDLIISGITWSPTNPSVGSSVTFTVTIKNQGSGGALSSYVYYYIDGTKVTSDSVSSIPAGGTTTESFSWTATSGSHAVKAVADADNRVSESNEGNNEKTVTFTGTPSDLIISGITWSPTNPAVGSSVTFTVTIKNQGSGGALSSYVYYYIDGSKVDSDSVSSIPAGDTTTETFSWKAKAGSHSVKAVADAGNTVSESNEGNNDKTVTFKASPTPTSTPKLTPSSTPKVTPISTSTPTSMLPIAMPTSGTPAPMPIFTPTPEPTPTPTATQTATPKAGAAEVPGWLKWIALIVIIAIGVGTFLWLVKPAKKPGLITIERTIYDPTKRNFIISKTRPLTNVKKWIEKNDPSMYWLVMCINNNTNKSIDRWDVKIYLPSVLKILNARIEGVEHILEAQTEKSSEIGSIRYVFSVPPQLRTTIPSNGSSRMYFKIIADADACGISYSIKGTVSTPDAEIPIKEKSFKYSCDANTIDNAIVTYPKGAKDLISSVIRGYYTGKEAVRIIDSFETIIDISNADDKTRADDLKSKLKQLRSLIFEDSLLNKIDEFHRRTEQELFDSGYLDSNYVRRTKQFCEEFIKDWKGEFLR